jgi:hypothetical protein
VRQRNCNAPGPRARAPSKGPESRAAGVDGAWHVPTSAWHCTARARHQFPRFLRKPPARGAPAASEGVSSRQSLRVTGCARRRSPACGRFGIFRRLRRRPGRTRCAARGRGPRSWSSRWLPRKEEEERVEERGKRGEETQRGALATRNPLARFALPGEKLVRTEERRYFATSPDEPPRSTRDVPVAGPGGFVDGLDA